MMCLIALGNLLTYKLTSLLTNDGLFGLYLKQIIYFKILRKEMYIEVITKTVKKKKKKKKKVFNVNCTHVMRSKFQYDLKSSYLSFRLNMIFYQIKRIHGPNEEYFIK